MRRVLATDQETGQGTDPSDGEGAGNTDAARHGRVRRLVTPPLASIACGRDSAPLLTAVLKGALIRRSLLGGPFPAVVASGEEWRRTRLKMGDRRLPRRSASAGSGWRRRRGWLLRGSPSWAAGVLGLQGLAYIHERNTMCDMSCLLNT